MNNEKLIKERASVSGNKGTKQNIDWYTVEISQDSEKPEIITIFHLGFEPFQATHIKIGEYSDRKTTLLVVMMEQKPETFCFLDALETKCAQSKFQMGDAISFASYRREVDE